MKRFNANSIAGKAVLSILLTSVLLLMLSAFTLTTTASAAELVVNGGFEEPVVPTHALDRGWATYYGSNHPLGAPDDCPADNLPGRCNDDVRIPGWSVFWTDDIANGKQFNPGRLEIQTGDTGGTAPPEGIQKAELDSHHRVGNGNTNVTIAQFMPTCPLADYTLSYVWKSRTEITGDNTVHVYIDDEERVTHLQNSDWQMQTLDFTSNNSGQTLILFGSIGNETTNGMFLDDVSVTGPDCSLVCDEKPYDMTFKYDGDDDSDNDQSGNEVVISPEVVYPFPNPANIEVYGHKYGKTKRALQPLATFEGVEIGELFSVHNVRSNWRIPPRMTFEIYDPENDDLVQTVTFHTSCSQPLKGHDEFGAITVWNALP
jgi:hypothetical protein